MNNRITNLEYLNTISEGDTEFKTDLIRTFLTNSLRQVEQIKTSLKAKEWKKVGDIAHSLKPSFTLMGMDDQKQIAVHIEKSGREARNLDKLPEMVDKLDEVVSRACKELEIELDSLT